MRRPGTCDHTGMTGDRHPASVARRAAAFGLDYLLIAGWLVLVVGGGALLRLAAPGLAAALFGNPLIGEATGFLVLTLPVSAYFAATEAGPAGASWGKRRLGLRVTTVSGQDLRLSRSVLRTGLKFLPWELTHAIIWRFANPGSAPEVLLNIGLVVVWALIAANLASALLDDRRRTLYDRLSGTRVVQVRQTSRQG
jgi:uncharacterized RDD family membrane protein YckC